MRLRIPEISYHAIVALFISWYHCITVSSFIKAWYWSEHFYDETKTDETSYNKDISYICFYKRIQVFDFGIVETNGHTTKQFYYVSFSMRFMALLKKV